ncbi:MAG: hypothetical protein ACI4J4_00765 [Ruminiclostridium sp.]
MWKGVFDEKMEKLFDEYNERFGCDPDTYEEIAYHAMSYDEFAGYIEECLEKGLEISRVVE